MREFMNLIESHWGEVPAGHFLDLFSQWESAQPDKDSVFTEFEKWGDDEVYIDSLTVADDARGSGIGGRTLEAIIQCAHEAKVLLTLTPVWQDEETDEDRTPLTQWYRRFGFESGTGNHLQLDCREDA